MKIEAFAPSGRGIKESKRLRKIVLVADNVAEQEELYWMASNLNLTTELYKARPVAGEDGDKEKHDTTS